ncbi:VCBS repeat-containing protein, partial [candidate division KSB1 bacterium]|nr:VCBS repeat-containing protein [candidate division KSB1 bacterium]
MDLIGISQTNELIFWLENDGKQKYTKHFISSNVPPSFWIKDIGQQASYIFPIDMEKDGDKDILYSVPNNYGYSGFIGWFENDGKLNFSLHELVKYDGANQIMGIDFDFDGDVDIIASSWKSGLIWLENDCNLNFVPHLLCNENKIISFLPFDMDNDNDYDYDLFIRFGRKLEYWENKNNLTYNRNYFDANISDFTFWDFDNDGDFDILGSKGAYLQWDDPEAIPFVFFWQNDGMQNFIKKDLFQGIGYFKKLADFDLDGDQDILTTEYYAEQDSINGYNKFELVQLGVDASYMKVTDLDLDGDPDLISSSGSQVFWYENLGKPHPISFPDSNLSKTVRHALGD